MKRIDRKQQLLLSLGLFVISSSFILKHFINLSDAENGFIIGVGIGLEIVSLIYYRKKRKGSISN